ncbi:MAG: VanW family protein [Eubacterium sp.]|nr:VanW family protein [Eubacterium sp.]
MKRENIKKLLCLLMCVVFLSAFASCAVQNSEEKTTTQTTATSTTVPTTVTTTEDENTTFPENKTRKIYKGLSKDKKGDFPYKIATYSTYYNSGDTTRTQNLKTAVSKVNNIVVPKGEVFSFNQTVGKRTVTAGYETAKVVSDREFVDGLGGGVCQVSSTIFECALRTNAEIVERTCHTLKVGYVPLGGDATVQWNSKDFKFRNTSGADFRIKMACDSGTLTCSIYANKDIDIGDISINISRSGDTYTLTRSVNGKQNYSTSSHYQEQKTTTKKAKEKKKKKDKEKTTKKDKKETTTEKND